MDIDRLSAIAGGFVTLLLLPSLGVVGLMQKRAIPVLAWTLVGWTAVGAYALYTHQTWSWSENRFLHGWLLGLGLGSAFLLIAWVRNHPRVAPWVKIGLALVTLAVFAFRLLKFLESYT